MGINVLFTILALTYWVLGSPAARCIGCSGTWTKVEMSG